ncbi:hypothetical protein HBI49_092940 [Parastagonospora nodorum]|nr:hypothetical protein HBH47_116520 [Parastagonospora nodorum]KAH4681978.1 hypothetical protein HBH78_128830 [Parastagonospora nodorum]KAH4777469.1 hypothetical protein HBH62_155470 [Parastagonospora nodorum]KAH4779376.1 hypothetical protein HBH63_128910 [Parastagonospora nodorum]KAH5076892.1 hypothetical protein HBH95_114060 [Parastagonospora nodorum]
MRTTDATRMQSLVEKVDATLGLEEECSIYHHLYLAHFAYPSLAWLCLYHSVASSVRISELIVGPGQSFAVLVLNPLPVLRCLALPSISRFPLNERLRLCDDISTTSIAHHI